MKLRPIDIDWQYPPIVNKLQDVDSGEMISGTEIEFATFGPHIVRNGEAIKRAELRSMAREGQFYDLRHLLLFGRIPRGQERWIDAGLAAFWNDDQTINQCALEKALGDPPRVVSIDVGQFFDEAHRAGKEDEDVENMIAGAMQAKGYLRVGSKEELDNLEERGCFFLDMSSNVKFLHVLFRDGIYSQHVIGIREDGWLIDVLICGLSNRVGMTLLDTAKTLVELGAEEAIVLDAGGDVMLTVQDRTVVKSAEGERDRMRSLLLWTSRRDQSPQSDTMRIDQYAWQWRV